MDVEAIICITGFIRFHFIRACPKFYEDHENYYLNEFNVNMFLTFLRTFFFCLFLFYVNFPTIIILLFRYLAQSWMEARQEGRKDEWKEGKIDDR